jgi:hypothetical protein
MAIRRRHKSLAAAKAEHQYTEKELNDLVRCV